MQYETNFDNLLTKSPMDLSVWLLNEFPVQIPEMIVTSEDMENAGKTLLYLASVYSYLSALSSHAKLKTREAKRFLSKEEHEDMVDRKELIENFKESIKHSYAAVSRAVTIYIENNAELKMSRGTT